MLGVPSRAKYSTAAFSSEVRLPVVDIVTWPSATVRKNSSWTLRSASTPARALGSKTSAAAVLIELARRSRTLSAFDSVSKVLRFADLKLEIVSSVANIAVRVA